MSNEQWRICSAKRKSNPFESRENPATWCDNWPNMCKQNVSRIKDQGSVSWSLTNSAKCCKLCKNIWKLKNLEWHRNTLGILWNNIVELEKCWTNSLYSSSASTVPNHLLHDQANYSFSTTNCRCISQLRWPMSAFCNATSRGSSAAE